MSARDKSRFTTTQAAWIALVVFGGWLVFLFMPTSRKVRAEPSPALLPVGAQSRLEEVGLANNSDWLGLPDYFAIWADALEWSANKTRFAYWDPGSSSYAYFFEATREDARVRFRAISAREAGMGAGQWVNGTMIFEEEDLARYAEERKAGSPTHPFVFAHKFLLPKLPLNISVPLQPVAVPAVVSPEPSHADPKK